MDNELLTDFQLTSSQGILNLKIIAILYRDWNKAQKEVAGWSTINPWMGFEWLII